MDCRCIEEIEKRIKTHFSETDTEHKKHAESFHTELSGKCLIFDGGLSLSLPVIVTYNKKTKARSIQKKTKVFNMLFKYCPFCGKEVKK